jgi:NTP pyrophosphatase (non-canonical NTP hydrolase)
MVEEFLKSLNNRNFMIKSAIDWQQNDERHQSKYYVDIEVESIDEVRYYIKTDKGIKQELRDYFSFMVPGCSIYAYVQKKNMGWKNSSL